MTGSNREVGDDCGIGFDDGGTRHECHRVDGAAHVVERARTFHHGAVLLRREHEGICTCTTGHAQLQDTGGTQHVIAYSSVQACVCNSIVLTVVPRDTCIAIGYGKVVIASAAEKTQRDLTIPGA